MKERCQLTTPLSSVILNSDKQNLPLNWLTAVIDSVGFIPTISSVTDLQANRLAGIYTRAITTLDAIHVSLTISDLPLRDEFTSKAYFWKRRIDKFLYSTRKGDFIGKTSLDFSFIKPMSRKTSAEILFTFNPTFSLLDKYRKPKFKSDYKMPHLTGIAAEKRNHFHPEYLTLPSNFDFKKELFNQLKEFETYFEEITKEIQSLYEQRLDFEIEILDAEFYADFITEDPVLTFFQLSWQIPKFIGDKGCIKGYDNKSQFLSLYAWEGPETRTAEAHYLAFSAFPKAKSKTAGGSIVRYEIRLHPARQSYVPLKVVIPSPHPLSSHKALTITWILTDWIYEKLEQIGYGDKLLTILEKGSIHLKARDPDLMQKLAKARNLGLAFTLETRNRRAKSGSTSTLFLLRLTTGFRLCYKLSQLFGGILEGSFDDKKFVNIVDQRMPSTEKWYRRLNKVAKLPTKEIKKWQATNVGCRE